MKKDRKNRWLVTLIFLVILFTTLPWGALGEASLGAARMDVFLRNSVHTLISSSFAVVFSYALLRVFRGGN